MTVDNTISTEIEVLPAPSALAPLPANPGQSRQQQLAELRAEAEFLEVAYGLAEKACAGNLVAAHFRGKPADGAIAIAFGSSLGWHWTKSLQDVYVMNGKPSIQSKEIRELLIRGGHEIWEEEVGPTRVVLAGRRRGSDVVVRVEWTMEKAEQAKLTSNPNYSKFPEHMLYARCTTDLGKRLAPDALSGLGVVEALQDVTPTARVESRRPPANARRGVDGLRAAIAPSAAVDAEPEPQPESKPETGMSAATRTKWVNAMFAALGEADCTDRDGQIVVIATLAGRPETPPEHRDGVTDDELRTVVNALNEARKDNRLGEMVTDILNEAALREAEAQQ